MSFPMSLSSAFHLPAVFPYSRRGGGWLRLSLHRLIAAQAARPDLMALRHLSQVSDAQLAAQGLDRLEELRRIMGPRSYG